MRGDSRRQFIWFTLIGGAQYVLDVALLYGLLLLGMDIAWANLLSRATIGLAGFLANRFITFHDTTSSLASSFPRFLIAWALTSLASTVGILWVLQLLFDGAYTANSGIAVKILVEIVVFVVAFLIQKYWIFPREHS